MLKNKNERNDLLFRMNLNKALYKKLVKTSKQ